MMMKTGVVVMMMWKMVVVRLYHPLNDAHVSHFAHVMRVAQWTVPTMLALDVRILGLGAFRGGFGVSPWTTYRIF